MTAKIAAAPAVGLEHTTASLIRSSSILAHGVDLAALDQAHVA
jgi:hypothetical protein